MEKKKKKPNNFSGIDVGARYTRLCAKNRNLK